MTRPARTATRRHGKHVVVVGAGGNIGSHLVPHLGREPAKSQLALQCLGAGRPLEDMERAHHGSDRMYLASAEEMGQTREALKEKKVPTRSQVWKLKKPTPATMRCMRCGNEWEVTFDLSAGGERMCPACRNNGVRVVLNGRG